MTGIIEVFLHMNGIIAISEVPLKFMVNFFLVYSCYSNNTVMRK